MPDLQFDCWRERRSSGTDSTVPSEIAETIRRRLEDFDTKESFGALKPTALASIQEIHMTHCNDIKVICAAESNGEIKGVHVM